MSFHWNTASWLCWPGEALLGGSSMAQTDSADLVLARNRKKLDSQSLDRACIVNSNRSFLFTEDTNGQKWMRNPEWKILQPLEKATRHSVEIMLDTFKCCSFGLGTQSLLCGPAATSLLLKDAMLLLPLLPAPSLCSRSPHSHPD